LKHHLCGLSRADHLERWLSVLEHHLEVCLAPLTSFGRGLESVALAAEGVVADSGCVAGAVRLASGLAPDEGIDVRVTSVSGGANTKACSVDVAPVTPLLAETSDTVTDIYVSACS
jgi:hypothetical protein